MPVRLLVEEGPHPGVARALVLRRARVMLEAVQCPEAEWSIVLTGDAQIQKLNRIYRHKDRPTDVLAFAQQEGELAEQAGAVLGDVIVSVPTARRQAEESRRSVADEVTTLLAHGLLHLLGWDHDTDARDRRMKRETARLCAAASAPAPPKKRTARARRKTTRTRR